VLKNQATRANWLIANGFEWVNCVVFRRPLPILEHAGLEIYMQYGFNAFSPETTNLQKNVMDIKLIPISSETFVQNMFLSDEYLARYVQKCI
jgi:hypothetical protein